MSGLLPACSYSGNATTTRAGEWVAELSAHVVRTHAAYLRQYSRRGIK